MKIHIHVAWWTQINHNNYFNFNFAGRSYINRKWNWLVSIIKQWLEPGVIYTHHPAGVRGSHLQVSDWLKLLCKQWTFHTSPFCAFFKYDTSLILNFKIKYLYNSITTITASGLLLLFLFALGHMCKLCEIVYNKLFIH